MQLSRSALRELKQILAECERQQDHLAVTIQQLRGVIESFGPEEEEPAGPLLPAKTLRNALVDILRAVGEPQHYKDLHRQVLAEGLAVNGKDPERNITAHLSNDDRFVPLGNGIWGLASWQRSRPVGRDVRGQQLRVLGSHQPTPPPASHVGVSRPELGTDEEVSDRMKMIRPPGPWAPTEPD